MSKEEKETEQPNQIVNIAEKILEFNIQQRGQSLKILTPDQMLNRLPIILAQLNAGYNSEKRNKRNQTIIVFWVQIKKTSKTGL